MTDIHYGAHTATIVGEVRTPAPAEEQKVFVLKPMLQLGSDSGRGFGETLELVWFAYSSKRHWKCFVRSLHSLKWKEARLEKLDTLVIADHEIHRLSARIKVAGQKHRDSISGEADNDFEYKLLLDNVCVFTAAGKYPSRDGGDQRTVVFGDFADGAKGASIVAAAAKTLSPHLVVMPGDIVYKSGLFSEYRKHLDPVLNGREPEGVALASTTVMVAAVGNHDVRVPDHEDEQQQSSQSDLFAYFRTWRHPSNGPRLKKSEAEEMVTKLKRKEGKMLFDEFGAEFISKSNFYFSQGEAHWVVIDANKYMDWRNSDLQKWLKRALRAGRNKRWKFVTFHQPGFNSDAKYRSDWRMRVLAPIFEEYGVDIVFSGHCHFYERHRPIRYHPHDDQSGKKRNPRGFTTVDLRYDGDLHRRPDGVIYIITGAGGTLLKPHLRPSIRGVSETTYKLCDERNSLSVLDISQRTLTVRQLDPGLQEIDRFVIEK